MTALLGQYTSWGPITKHLPVTFAGSNPPPLPDVRRQREDGTYKPRVVQDDDYGLLEARVGDYKWKATSATSERVETLGMKEYLASQQRIGKTIIETTLKEKDQVHRRIQYLFRRIYTGEATKEDLDKELRSIYIATVPIETELSVKIARIYDKELQDALTNYRKTQSGFFARRKLRGLEEIVEKHRDRWELQKEIRDEKFMKRRTEELNYSDKRKAKTPQVPYEVLTADNNKSPHYENRDYAYEVLTGRNIHKQIKRAKPKQSFFAKVAAFCLG